MNETIHRRASTERRPFLHMPVPWVFVLAYLLGVGLQFLGSGASIDLGPIAG